MKSVLAVCVTVAVWAAAPVWGEGGGEQSPIGLRRVGERVLVLTDNTSPGKNNLTAIASEAGIVVVDTTTSPVVAALMRARIEQELGRDDFAYTINTHHHGDHFFGNQVFESTQIIAHERAVQRMCRAATGQQISPEPWLEESVEKRQSRLEGLDPTSAEAAEVKAEIEGFLKARAERDRGFVPTLPTVTFNDRLTLDLGDLTLELFYYGQADTNNSIVGYIPEERLFLAGDLFWFGGVFSLFDDGLNLEIERWIEVLTGVLGSDRGVDWVIGGHQNIWPGEHLRIRRDYIVDLWREVRAAKAQGKNLVETTRLLTLERFAYLEKLVLREALAAHDLSTEEYSLERQHSKNVAAFWRQLQRSAAAEIEAAVVESGAEGARSRLEEIHADTSDFYYVDERELNALGYRLIGEDNLEGAMAVLEINVALHPGSWNAYDSLGEALMYSGREGDAKTNFERSLELNPGNDNSQQWLDRLEGQAEDRERETAAAIRFDAGENSGLQGPYLGQEPPGREPQIFAPGIVSSTRALEFSITFSPDGKEIYFTRRRDGERNKILVTRWQEHGWTAPEPAWFNGEHANHEPHLARAGTRMFWGSRRPLQEGDEEGTYGIWVVDSTEHGWTEPRYLFRGMYATAASNGNVYLTDIYEIAEGGVALVPYVDGEYGEYRSLGGGVNAPTPGVHPFIAPDESFIIFDATRPGGQGGEGDLYVCFRRSDGRWGEAINLGDAVNSKGTNFCAALSPDGKYIFYTKYRDLYWVSTRILDDLRP